jgi:hypothetical protein
MVKRRVTIAAVVAGMLAMIPAVYFGSLFAAHGYSRDFLAIDSCLDAGGGWNYTGRTCER